MYPETVFISKIVDYSRVLENKDYGFGPRKIDLKGPGFMLFTSPSEYEAYALTECHSDLGSCFGCVWPFCKTPVMICTLRKPKQLGGGQPLVSPNLWAIPDHNALRRAG